MVKNLFRFRVFLLISGLNGPVLLVFNSCQQLITAVDTFAFVLTFLRCLLRLFWLIGTCRWLFCWRLVCHQRSTWRITGPRVFRMCIRSVANDCCCSRFVLALLSVCCWMNLIVVDHPFFLCFFVCWILPQFQLYFVDNFSENLVISVCLLILLGLSSQDVFLWLASSWDNLQLQELLWLIFCCWCFSLKLWLATIIQATAFFVSQFNRYLPGILFLIFIH